MAAALRIPVGPLHEAVAATFAAAGCEPDEAERVAGGLVDANLTGHDSHGVARVPRYVQWLASGEVEAGRHVAVVTENDAMALLDGQFGFGASVGADAVRHGIEKARGPGVAIVALRNAGHLGRIGQWAEMALEAGLVSLHIVNVAGSTLVAPFGGVDRRFSTAPIAFGFPVPDEPPVILDFATSAVAEGKVLVAANGGKPLAPGVLIDPSGRLSNEPETLYGPLAPDGPRDHRNGSGAIRTMGEHKGSGLALMCELLAGAFTGGGCSGPHKRRFANGMVSIYMSPEAFGSGSSLARDTREFLDYVRTSRPAVPGEPVVLPGEPERRARADRLANGIPLTPETIASLRHAALAAGLPAEDSRLAILA